MGHIFGTRLGSGVKDTLVPWNVACFSKAKRIHKSTNHNTNHNTLRDKWKHEVFQAENKI